MGKDFTKIPQEVIDSEYRDLQGVRWRYIYGSEDCWVSEFGKVRWKKKVLPIRQDPAGYQRVTVKGLGRIRVHRLVAEAFIENPEGKPLINHISGDKTQNTIENLEWATYSENSQHAVDTGLIRKKDKMRTGNMIVETDIESRQSIIYASQKECADHNGISLNRINSCLNKITKSCNGKLYTYLNMDMGELRSLVMYKNENLQKKVDINKETN